MPGLTNEARLRLGYGIDWLGIFFAILAIAAGTGVALAVRQFGVTALLLIPAVGLFIISIVYPELGVITLIIVTYTQLSNVLIKFHNLPSISQPLAALLLVVILIRVAALGDRAQGWISAALRFAGYGFVLILSVLAAKAFQPAYVEFQDYVKDILVAMIIVTLVQNPRRFKHAVWAIIFAGILIGSVSVYQHLTSTYANDYFGLGGWVTETTGQTSAQRVTGPFSNPNAFSQVLVVVVILALDRLWHERNLLLRLAAGWGLVICSLAILYSYSRGGLLALIFALAVLIIERRPNFFPVAFTVAIGLFVLQFLPEAYTARLATLTELLPFGNAQISTSSYRGRLSENMASWMMFRDNPVLGVGLKNFPEQYQSYSRQLGLDPRNTARSPASLYGEVIAEQGLVGLIVFFAFMGSVHTGLRRAKRLFLEAAMTDEANYVTALWAGLAGYLFAAITKNSAYSNVFWMLIGLGIAALSVAVNSHRTHQKKQEMDLIQQGSRL
jgi:O-antigen ligase